MIDQWRACLLHALEGVRNKVWVCGEESVHIVVIPRLLDLKRHRRNVQASEELLDLIKVVSTRQSAQALAVLCHNGSSTACVDLAGLVVPSHILEADEYNTGYEHAVDVFRSR